MRNLQETVFYNNKKFGIVGIGINVDRSPKLIIIPQHMWTCIVKTN